MGLFLENKEPSLRKEARKAMLFLKEAKLVGWTHVTPAPWCGHYMRPDMSPGQMSGNPAGQLFRPC